MREFGLILLILNYQSSRLMKKHLLFLFIFWSVATLAQQSDDLWQKSNAVSLMSKSINASVSDSGKLYYRLNTERLQTKLAPVTSITSKSNTVEITIPNSDGKLERFIVWESSNFDPELQAKYPEIRSYEGSGLDDKTAKIHFSVSPLGLQTMVFRSDKATEFIEGNPDNKSEYVLFAKKSSSDKFLCTTNDVALNKTTTAKTAKTSSNSKVFKTLRLALSCTAEYTTYFGGTKAGALAGMNATMTRVNGVFNKDLAVKLILIANTDEVIYTNAETDPYDPPAQGTAENGATWPKAIQTTLTTVIGDGNYDIGHLFGASGGGGNAGCIGCVCVSPVDTEDLAKGSAYTSPSDGKPEGDTFDIDFVAHEMGHQLGANHTFSYLSGERTSVNIEPGSGSTIMGYAGITDYDVQDTSDDYFAYASILQIQENLARKTCPVSTPVTNNPPTIIAGNDYVIPISTPFVLTGSGSDPEGNTITYNWEQNDNSITTTDDKSIAYPTKPDGPLFRSVKPGSSSVRYMPDFSSVLQNILTTKWESVSSVARTLHFTLTGRDNAALGLGQTNTDEMMVTVSASAGPFEVTSHASENLTWLQDAPQTVTWDVKNTNTLPGSSTVNIKLSTDGGANFPITLAANTPNDGSEVITLPSSVPDAKYCRILIEPTDNIYYALNKKAFAIGYKSSITCDSYSFESSFPIPNTTTFFTKTLTVPASDAVISDVNVSVNITHDNFSDLEIQMVSPQGTVVRLFNKSCGGSNGTKAFQFDDAGAAIDCSKTTEQIIVPVDLLSAFNGENLAGTWTLGVRDAVVGSFGTVNSASITICGQVFKLGNEDFENINFNLYPNPNKGSFTVEFESNSGSGARIFVHDVLGRTVYSKTFENTTHFNQNIQLSNVVSGMYFVTVIDGDRRTVKKIIVN